MLIALIETTLGDDVFREDETTKRFESEVARLLGHEEGCFVTTGTMANQLALRGLLYQPPYGILCDASAHIVNYEGAGPAHTCGASVQAISPGNGRYLTVEDVELHAIVTDDVHRCPTRVVSLENTCAGMILPLSDVAAVSKWSRARNIKLHLDGARLWEAVATGAGSAKQYGQLFDCVTVDFSKGLGAPMGAMIVGNAELIHQIRRVRKNIGGGLRQAGVLSSMAQAALKENFGGDEFTNARLREVHEMAKEISNSWMLKGGKLLLPTETNQVWLDLDAVDIKVDDFNKLGMQHGIKLNGRRIVVHNQVSLNALSRLDEVFEEIFKVTTRVSDRHSELQGVAALRQID